MRKYDVATIGRYVLLIIAVINSVLNLVGYQTISNELANDIVAAITGIYTLYVGGKGFEGLRKARKIKEDVK
ncbi:phage holin [Bacillus sp. DX4.1]|uniref:phage holin n=1 Tax=Bacillus sp. DX4.1 TaxID=3055867 RepID=UPI0025A183E1|nr:phage holin [Bacillus sp. DX4.1]MDM5188626.1 phage holin [Bacillus sp. DX4.1]